jgi:hypothetical protein
MGLGRQFYAPAVLSEENTSNIHQFWSCIAAIGVVKKRKMSFSCQDLNPEYSSP